MYLGLPEGTVYYGAGHGLMLRYEYDLNRSLMMCDAAGGKVSSCWFGVFYENVFGIMKGRITPEKSNGFNEKDPAAPCNQVDERYKYMCYKTHGMYLVWFYERDLERAIESCIYDVEPGYQEVCAEDIGSYVRFPSGQNLVQSVSAEKFTDKAVHLCKPFWC